MEDIERYPLSFRVELIYKAIRERSKKMAWEMYLVSLPHQDPKKRMTFDQYLKKVGLTDKPKEKEIDQAKLDRLMDLADLVR
jgi:hypothetical protein